MHEELLSPKNIVKGSDGKSERVNTQNELYSLSAVFTCTKNGLKKDW